MLAVAVTLGCFPRYAPSTQTAVFWALYRMSCLPPSLCTASKQTKTHKKHKKAKFTPYSLPIIRTIMYSTCYVPGHWL